VAVTNRDPNLQTLNPRWPEFNATSPAQVRFTYDRPTDTLFVDFHGEARPAASIALARGDRDYLFLRVDPETEEVVGLQIEHFLSYAVTQHPELIGALDLADLVGINRSEVEQIASIHDRRLQRRDQATVLADVLRLGG
jgi:hypothetical protein